MKHIWQDLDLFNTYEWKSTKDGSRHKKTIEDNRIFKFSAGLNVEFDEVRGRIIGRQPLPSIGEVFSEVKREESWRNVMLGKKGLGVTIEGSALVTTSGGYNKGPSFQHMKNHEFGVIFATSLTIPMRIVGKSIGNQKIGKKK